MSDLKKKDKEVMNPVISPEVLEKLKGEGLITKKGNFKKKPIQKEAPAEIKDGVYTKPING